MRLEAGQTVAITGGGSGIGRALALALAARGLAVAIGDIEADAAARVAAEVAALGVRSFAARLDVLRADQLDGFAARCFAELGGCDLLCNNAGVLVLGDLLDASDADWEWVLGVNLMGAVRNVRAFAPRMIAAGRPGHILNTVSLRGLAASAKVGVYAASKFALMGYSEALAAELAPHRIGVTALCPWSVDTAIVASDRNRPGGGAMSPDDLQAMIDAVPASDITISAQAAAAVAIEAVESGTLHAITHPCARELLAGRFDAILASLDEVRARHPELP